MYSFTRLRPAFSAAVRTHATAAASVTASNNWFSESVPAKAIKTEANIVLLGGDGIGPEVVAIAKDVLQIVADKKGYSFTFTEHLFGGCSIDAHGDPLTTETLEACRA
eukprot:gene12455-10594_t